MSEKRLVCSKHPDGGPYYLEELPSNNRIVRCPECGGEWQNFIKYSKYPVATVHAFRQEGHSRRMSWLGSGWT